MKQLLGQLVRELPLRELREAAQLLIQPVVQSGLAGVLTTSWQPLLLTNKFRKTPEFCGPLPVAGLHRGNLPGLHQFVEKWVQLLEIQQLLLNSILPLVGQKPGQLLLYTAAIPFGQRLVLVKVLFQLLAPF